MSKRFLSAEKVIDSLRDNGYNNTAYALGELIDNSLQAKATRVELGLIEEIIPGKDNFNISKIFVWDNGKGMSPATLTQAMQFGGGENRKDPSGMGKFGMGLPNSSISQCKRVDVWTWQDGGEPNYTYLDIDEMKGGNLEDVPVPVSKPLPPEIEKVIFTTRPVSGTLVLWSRLDRVRWKTAASIFKHCEHLVGRMYRRFLNTGKVKIECVKYQPAGKNLLSGVTRQPFLANDPMYLMKNTTLEKEQPLPGSYAGESFFEIFDEQEIDIDYFDENGHKKNDKVIIRASVAKRSITGAMLGTLKTDKANLGSSKWGRHLEKNIGVSILRSERELILNDAFFPKELRQYKGRYFGIEVEIPPSLDVIFGVLNNKQNAIHLAPYEMEDLRKQAGFESEQDYLRDLEENEDQMLQVFKVTNAISMLIKNLSKEVETLPTSRNKATDNSNTGSGAAGKATAGSEHREHTGHKTDSFDEVPTEDDILDHLKKTGMGDEEAKSKAETIIKQKLKYYIDSAPLDSDAFFDVAQRKGLTLVLFNTNHIFYKKFISTLPEAQLELMQVAVAGFARVMNETTNESKATFLNIVRREWGKVITDFLEEEFLEEIDFE